MKGDNTMHTFENNTKTIAPDARDFLGGNYLSKKDLSGVTTVTVIDVQSVAIPGAQRRKLVVSFQELEKPLILNKTNTRLLAEIFATTDTAMWRGKITLYVESNVEYAGRVVGGIRIQAEAVRKANDNHNLVPTPVVNGHRDVGMQLQEIAEEVPFVQHS